MDKQLYKTSYNKMIAGVCNGLAEYFNVDVSLVRIGFVLATLLSFGTGVFFYVVLAVILPTKNY